MELQLQTVSAVSKNFGISTRMLRYYEQIGLIESQRKENYSYRVYDETAVKRLRQIILLRKLRIPMKQIKDILDKQDVTPAIIEVFQRHVGELNEEISSLSAIRDILNGFIKTLEKQTNIKVTFDLLNDESVSNIISSLKLPKNYIKEENLIMEELNKSNEKEIENLNTIIKETYDNIQVQFGVGLLPLLDEKQGSNFYDRIKHLKQKIADDMGVVIGYLAFIDNIRIPPNSYVIKVKGKEVATAEIKPDRFMIMEHGVTTEYKGIFADIDGIEAKEPAFGIPAKWIELSNVEKAEMLGYHVIDPMSVIITHLNEIIKTHAGEF